MSRKQFKMLNFKILMTIAMLQLLFKMLIFHSEWMEFKFLNHYLAFSTELLFNTIVHMITNHIHSNVLATDVILEECQQCISLLEQ